MTGRDTISSQQVRASEPAGDALRDQPHSRLNTSRLNLAGIGLSLVLHSMLAGVVLNVDLSSRTDPAGQLAAAGLSGPDIALDWLTPPSLPPEPSPESTPPPKPVEIVPVPEPLKPVPIPPEPKPQALALGISESQQDSPNWIGFADPTEHRARQSSVVQPALDPVAGTPGEPTQATPAQPAIAPVTAPSMPEVFPEPSANPAPTATQDPIPAVDPVPEPATAAAQIERPGPLADRQTPPDAKPGEVATPPIDTPASDPKDPLVADGPMQEEITKKQATAGDPASRSAIDGFVGPLPDSPGEGGPQPPSPPPGQRSELSGKDDLARPAKPASAPPEMVMPMGTKARQETTGNGSAAEPTAPAPTPSPAAATPTPNPAASTSAPVPPRQAQPGSTAAASGDGAQRPAERSEKQSEPTSLEETIQVRLGRPAAAQGLEIFTRRPKLTSLTIVTSSPRNPLVRVIFGRSGDVLDVDLLESSGVKDIDDPVVNAVFLWTARGEALERIRSDAPEAGLRVTVRILLK